MISITHETKVVTRIEVDWEEAETLRKMCRLIIEAIQRHNLCTDPQEKQAIVTFAHRILCEGKETKC